MKKIILGLFIVFIGAYIFISFNDHNVSNENLKANKLAFIENFNQNPNELIIDVFNIDNCLLQYNYKLHNPYYIHQEQVQINLSNVSILSFEVNSAKSNYWTISIDNIVIRASLYMPNYNKNVLTTSEEKEILSSLYNYLSENIKKCNIPKSS